MKTIKLNNPNYVLKTKQYNNGSNYGLSIGVYKKGEKMPIVGTIVKNDTAEITLRMWAEKQLFEHINSQALEGIFNHEGI